MRDKERKKQQSIVNKIVRKMNQNIYDDDLWLGRFTIHQYDARYSRFEDNSGGILMPYFILTDKKTGKTKDIMIPYRFLPQSFAYDVWQVMNDFIVDDCGVWEEKPDIRNNRIDFREKRKNA